MASPDPALPSRVGPYRVLRQIARGGMAAVMAVEDERSGQRLALKLLFQRGQALARFHREYEVLTAMDHPQIARVYRYGQTEDGQHYITMELLDGVPAQVYAKSCGRPGSPRRTGQVTRVAVAVAEALSELHSRGVVHRDIKSSNVMVLRDGMVKLVDFGTASLEDALDPITRAGEFVGTVAYAAPEQLMGEAVDGRADIYALGVLLYRLLTGKRPFEADNATDMLRLLQRGRMRTPGEVVAGIPLALSQLVVRMLSWRRTDRPATAAILAQSLRAFCEELPAPEWLMEAHQDDVIGREAELRRIRSWLDRPRPGRLVLISGPEGAGKGRLLAQAETDGRLLGWLCLRGRFVGGVGLCCLGELMRQAARGLPLGDSGGDRDLEVICRADLLGPGAEAPGLLPAAVGLLRRRVELEQRPLLMLVEDMDRAPPLALHLLRALRQRAADGDLPLVIIGGCLDQWEEASPWVRELGSELRRLPLSPLPPADVARLLSALLGRREAPGVLCRRVHEATGGLPGHIVELVYAMMARGLVDAELGGDERVTWVDRSGGSLIIPTSLRELMEQQIGTWEPQVRRVAEALAVAGGELPEGLLPGMTELEPELVATRVQQMIQARLVKRVGDRLRFRLGMMVPMLREGMRSSRRAALQDGLARLLGEGDSGPERVRLWIAAGLSERAVAEAVRWAPRALAEGRSAEALSLLEPVAGALRAREELVARSPTEIELLLLFAAALRQTEGNAARALAILRDLPGPWTEAQRRSLLCEQLVHQRSAGEGAAAHQRLRRLVREEGAEPELRVLAAAWALEAGELEEAGALLTTTGEEAALSEEGRYLLACLRMERGELEAAVRGLPQETTGRTLWSGGPPWLAMELRMLHRSGKLSEALTRAEAGLQRARQEGRLEAAPELALTSVSLRIDILRLGEARELLWEPSLQQAVRREPALLAEHQRQEARLLLASLRPARALELLQPAIAQARARGLGLAALRMEGLLARCLFQQGRVLEARQLAGQCVEQAMQRGLKLTAGELGLICCETLGEGGELPAQLEEALDERAAPGLGLERALHCAERWRRLGRVPEQSLETRRAAALLASRMATMSAEDYATLLIHPWHRRLVRLGGALSAEDGLPSLSAEA